MSRFLALLSCLLLTLGLCTGVSAADTGTRAYSVNVFATVSADGSCDVTTTVTLHVETVQDKLTYPVPASASGVTLNGSPVLTEKSDQARLVNISRILDGMTGDFSFTVGYTVTGAVKTVSTKTEDGDPIQKLELELPLLAGFAYPMDELQFSINLPGVIDQDPRFVSGYHQGNIEKDLTYSVSGGNIAGRSWTSLKDHETLRMYLTVSEEMFPQTRMALPQADTVTNLVWICAGLALVYWLLFLRNFLPLREFPAVAPEGFGAGQMGTVLTMAGADLNLMAFSWAQLGYVILRMDRRGRVFLIKVMDMGNERTDFERKCFQKLFSRKDTVDTASLFYQRLTQMVAVQKSAPQLFHGKGRGSITVFRVLMAAAGLFSGTCFGILLGSMLDYGWLFMLVLSLVGAVCSWQIQAWPQGVFLHHRFRALMAGVLCLLWLVLGIVMGQFSLALTAVLLQAAAGLLASFGGRRTEEGRSAMGQVLCLRHHFGTFTQPQIRDLCQANPEVFFDMAPYAIALGRENIFARKFGNSRLPVCPYIQAPNTRGLTARQWSQLMRGILNGMSLRQRKSPMDGMRSVMDNYMR